jgi:hypothetical protein
VQSGIDGELNREPEPLEEPIGIRIEIGANLVGQSALQLDELRLTEGSPCRAAMEYYQGPTAASGLVQTEGVTMLIWQHHVGKTRTHGRIDVAEVNTKIPNRRHALSFAWETIAPMP